MFNNNPNTALFGPKTPQAPANTFGAPPAQQPPVGNMFGATQQPQPQTNIFGAQTQAPLGQQQPMQQSILGAPTLGQPTQQPAIGQGIFAQPTQQPFQQQPLMGGSIAPNPYQQQQPNMNHLAINDVNAFKEKFSNLQNKLTEIEKEKAAYSQPQHAQQWAATIQPIQQAIESFNSQTVLDTSQKILAGQKEMAKNLDEYITTVGLVQKITEDGLEALKKQESIVNDYQKAQQTMKESYDQMSGSVRINQTFSVPQKYQEQLIIQQRDKYNSLEETIEKMIKFYEKPPSREIDEALQAKLDHLQTLASYLYMLQLKIKTISERSNYYKYVAMTFQTKVYQQQMPDKKIEEFYTIDTHKEILDQINQESI